NYSNIGACAKTHRTGNGTTLGRRKVSTDILSTAQHIEQHCSPVTTERTVSIKELHRDTSTAIRGKIYSLDLPAGPIISITGSSVINACAGASCTWEEAETDTGKRRTATIIHFNFKTRTLAASVTCRQLPVACIGKLKKRVCCGNRE